MLKGARFAPYVNDGLCDPKRWAARREFAVRNRLLSENDTEAPDTAHVNIGGGLPLPIAALDIEAAAVPDAMIVAVLCTVRLSLWAMWLSPLWRQIPLCDRQRSGQPEHGPAAGQHPRNVLSRLRQHG